MSRMRDTGMNGRSRKSKQDRMQIKDHIKQQQVANLNREQKVNANRMMRVPHRENANDRHDRSRGTDTAVTVTGKQFQPHVCQAGDNGAAQIKTKKLFRTISRLNKLPKPKQKQHVEQDMPNAEPRVTKCIRDQPPNLTAPNHFIGVKLEPFLNN